MAYLGSPKNAFGFDISLLQRHDLAQLGCGLSKDQGESFALKVRLEFGGSDLLKFRLNVQDCDGFISWACLQQSATGALTFGPGF